jgi:hypothetical protein
MKRIHVALALLAAATFVVTGCGGGGGGGGDTTPKTTLSGRVLDSYGGTISGAQVNVDTGSTKAVLSGTANSSGYYSIGSVPLGVTINISVTSGGNSIQLNGLTIGTDAGSSTGMNVVLGGQAIPNGCTLSIAPDSLSVYAGETSIASIKVYDQFEQEVLPTESSSWKAGVVVTGSATLQLGESATTFGVKGGTLNQTAKITVLGVTAGGAVIGANKIVTIQSMDQPPPPPL